MIESNFSFRSGLLRQFSGGFFVSVWRDSVACRGGLTGGVA